MKRARTRTILNDIYRRLSPEQHAAWHRRFAVLFRSDPSIIEAGEWLVDFAGTTIRLPIRAEHAWLDWDAALSAVGHDPEVKQAYAMLLGSSAQLRVFFDIGANHGLHSLLMLAHGVRTVSFEPNPDCVDYLQVAAALNGLAPTIVPTAIGDRPGQVTLVYPQRETWLGSIDPAVQARFDSRDDAVLRTVSQSSVDDYVLQSGLTPDLIKIDTEGTEAAVIAGAAETIRRHRPLIIFESWTDADRELIDQRLRAAGYRIAALRLGRGVETLFLERPAFLTSPAINFLATP